MRNYFIFDGYDSRDFGVYISGQGTFNGAGRDYNLVSILGRNGDLILDNNRLENVELTYPAFIYNDFKNNVRDFRGMLLSRRGYRRLVDTYHPDEFRMAMYRAGLEVEATLLNNAGAFDVVFECKPQRFLVSGEAAVSFTSAGTITNPTFFEAKPLIRAYGAGSFTIGNITVTITSAEEYTDIDCEIMESYKGTLNRNLFVTTTDNEFPTLPAGETGIALDGVTKLEITPRWWTV